MARWMTFFKERFPLPVLLLISVGIALAGVSYGEGSVNPLYAVVASAFSFLFFSTLRLMDEVKDLEKDKVVHPLRPLPRGLIPIPEFQRAMFLSLGLMVVLVISVYAMGQIQSGHLFAFTVLYLWLMYKEFYFGQALQNFPLIYAITHQIISLFLNAGAVLITNPDITILDAMLKPGLIILGAFFTYEICRKLDPDAHPMLKTYRYVYGVPVTGLMTAITLAVAAYGSYVAYGTSWVSCGLWTIELVTIVGFVLFAKKKYKLVEALASLSLLTHIWLPTVFNFLRG